MPISFDDVALLPLPTVIEEVAFEDILADRKADFLVRAPVHGFNYDLVNMESSPPVILLEESAYRETVLRARGNYIARQHYLYFATGSAVDHFALFYDVVRLPDESDDRLKQRIILAIRGRSTGGTAPRYAFVAMSVSLRVADVFVYRDGTDPTVHIAVFSTDPGGVADAGLLAQVRAAVNDPAVVMVNDTLDVLSAVVAVQNVVADVKLLTNTPQTILADLAAALPGLWIAESGLGRDLTLDWLKAKLGPTGSVYSVTVTTPAATVVADPFEAIRIGTVTLNFAGRDF